VYYVVLRCNFVFFERNFVVKGNASLNIFWTRNNADGRGDHLLKVGGHSFRQPGTGLRCAQHRLWPESAGKRRMMNPFGGVVPKTLSRALRPKTVGRRPPVPGWQKLWLPTFRR